MTNVIYVGKTGNGVVHNQLFVNRPTSLIAELEKKTPGIGAQFVSVEEYAGVAVKAAPKPKPALKAKGAKKNG